MASRTRAFLIALLVCGLYSIAVATVAWNGSMEIKGNLTVDGTCTGCGGAPLETHSVSAVSEVDFTGGFTTAANAGTFSKYQVFINGLVPSTTSQLSLQVSTDGGSTWKSGGTDYYTAQVGGSPGGVGGCGVGSSSALIILPLTGGACGSRTFVTTAGVAPSGFFYIFAPTSENTQIAGEFNAPDSATSTPQLVFTSGWYAATTKVTAFRFTVNSGTMSGTFSVTGVQ